MVTAKKKSSAGLVVFVILALLSVIVAFKVFGPNTAGCVNGNYLYVRSGSSYEDLKKALTDGGFIADMLSFDLLAKQAKIPNRVRAGKYKITRGMSNYNIIRMLRNGRQEPVRLVITKLRTKNDFVRLISTHLEVDSTAMHQLLADPVYLAAFGLDTNTAMCAIMPDTYVFFWNVSADNAFKKIAKNYNRFWDDARKQQAREKGLTPEQITIVASIVEEETNKPDDKPNVASVYLNRIKKGMMLQADPTVKFAIGDFTIRRIAGVAMLHHESPYNTYMHTGLPPGPICTPSPGSIIAVLEAPATDYIYFCARGDFSGYHNFAATAEEHNRNAAAYHKAQNERNIH